MTSTDPSSRFFGLDSHELKQNWQLALSNLANWSALKWLKPAFITSIRMTNDRFLDYSENSNSIQLKEHQKPTPARFKGVLLPDDLVLWCPMVLPKLKPDAVAAAIALQVKNVSPFLPEDLVWSHTGRLAPTESGKTFVVIASRKIIAAHIASLDLTPLAQDQLEVWVKTPQSQDLLALDGFGENLRRKLATRWQTINFCLVFLLAALMFALAVTPTAQLRFRAVQALQDYTKLQALAAPALHQREQLVQLDQQAKALQTLIKQSVQPEQILLTVAQLLPDDTYITSLQTQDNKVSLTGQTPNTATLMQQLGTQPGVKNVRAPAAAIKQRGTERETFNLEFTLETPTVTAQP